MLAEQLVYLSPIAGDERAGEVERSLAAGEGGGRKEDETLSWGNGDKSVGVATPD